MSGYMMVHGTCALCGCMVSANPHRVPSIDNQPVCENCMGRVNAAREAAGMKPFPVPPDAYEPAPA